MISSTGTGIRVRVCRVRRTAFELAGVCLQQLCQRRAHASLGQFDDVVESGERHLRLYHPKLGQMP